MADLAPGCFVRIGIGQSSSRGSENKYLLAEIVEVAEGSHGHYTLMDYEYVPGSGKRTNRWVILRHGSNDRAFRITEISNSELTPKEFIQWQQAMTKDNRRGPLLRDVAAAEEQIARAENYRYTSEDVSKMVQEKNQSMGGLSHNLAGQKEILRRLIERAASEGDAGAVSQLQEQLAQVMVKLNRKLDKGGTQGVLAAINKRNNQLNDAKLSRGASENVARAKSGAPDESMNDPFSRRPTRMATSTYYTIKRDLKDGAKDAAATVLNPKP
jgi:RNA polymerase-associated protein RTF1